jgi:hypothetical protein
VKNIFAVALVVCVASIALSQNAKPPIPRADVGDVPPAAPPPGAIMIPVVTQMWEYKVSDRGGFDPGAWQKKLNDLAKEGWEFVTLDEGHYILRRSIRPVAPAGGFPVL